MSAPLGEVVQYIMAGKPAVLFGAPVRIKTCTGMIFDDAADVLSLCFTLYKTLLYLRDSWWRPFVRRNIFIGGPASSCTPGFGFLSCLRPLSPLSPKNNLLSPPLTTRLMPRWWGIQPIITHQTILNCQPPNSWTNGPLTNQLEICTSGVGGVGRGRQEFYVRRHTGRERIGYGSNLDSASPGQGISVGQ